MDKADRSSLQERLLRGGVAPRHVHRIVLELHAHQEDLTAAALARGATPRKAAEEARQRLGSDDAVLAAALARPELKSWGYRWPLLVCAVAPALLIALSVVLIVCALGASAALLRAVHPYAPGTTPLLTPQRIALFSRTLILYGVPLLWSALWCVYAARRRLALRWLIMGVIVAATFGAVVTFDFKVPSPGGHGMISAGLGFNSNAAGLRLLAARWLPTVLLSLGPGLLWRATRRRDLRLQD